jgi:hypothetical protein
MQQLNQVDVLEGGFLHTFQWAQCRIEVCNQPTCSILPKNLPRT